eukprot:354255-Chlamydomonas_euryale.AAC.7
MQAVKCGSARLRVVVAERQLAFNLVDDATAAGVDAHVLKRSPETWNVGLGLAAKDLREDGCGQVVCWVQEGDARQGARMWTCGKPGRRGHAIA